MNVVRQQAESVNPAREAFDDGEIELRKRCKLRTGQTVEFAEETMTIV